MTAITDIDVLNRDYAVPDVPGDCKWRRYNRSVGPVTQGMDGWPKLSPTHYSMGGAMQEWSISIRTQPFTGTLYVVTEGNPPPEALVAAGCAAMGQPTPAMLARTVLEWGPERSRWEDDLVCDLLDRLGGAQ